MGMNDKELFLLKEGSDSWQVVSKQSWVTAERRAGFHNTMGQPDEPGTAGFSGNGIQGSLVSVNYFDPVKYDFNPELRDAVLEHLETSR